MLLEPASEAQLARRVVTRVHFGATLLSNLDVVILLFLVLADIRVLKGSSFASYTLFELMIWGYCLPVVIARLGFQNGSIPIPFQRFLFPIGLYVSWLLLVSALSIVFRGDSGVLQDTKNILPVPVLVLFLLVRVRDIRSIALVCNLYVIYSVLACVLALLQYKYGAPYFRELIGGTEYKLGFEGEVIVRPVVGFSGHPNEFAMAILPGVALAALKLISEFRDGWRLRPVTLVVTAFLFLGLALSDAKGAILFTCAAIAFSASPFGRRRFAFKFIWTAILIVCIVLYGLHQAQSVGDSGAGTIETRYLLWQTSLDAIESDYYIFLFGDGMKFVTEWSGQIAGWDFSDAHNAWFDQVLFFGLPALVLYFSIWQRFFRIVDAAAPEQSLVGQALLDGLRATMLAFMGDYFFEPVAHAVFPLSELFFLMALALQIVNLGAGALGTGTPLAGRRFVGTR